MSVMRSIEHVWRGRKQPNYRPGARTGRAGAALDTKCRMRRFVITGSRRCGAWPQPSSVISCACGMASATAAPRAGPTTASCDPWMTRAGQLHLRAEPHDAVPVVGPFRVHAADDRLRVGLQGPPDRVFGLLGRVRLGERLGEEELHEPGPVAEKVVAIPLRPALLGRQLLVEGVAGLPRRRGRRSAADRARSAPGPRPARDARRRGSDRPRRRTTTRRSRARRELCPARRAHRRQPPAGRRRPRRAGRPERPLPRRSNVTTRPWRAK